MASLESRLGIGSTVFEMRTDTTSTGQQRSLLPWLAQGTHAQHSSSTSSAGHWRDTGELSCGRCVIAGAGRISNRVLKQWRQFQGNVQQSSGKTLREHSKNNGWLSTHVSMKILLHPLISRSQPLHLLRVVLAWLGQRFSGL